MTTAILPTKDIELRVLEAPSRISKTSKEVDIKCVLQHTIGFMKVTWVRDESKEFPEHINRLQQHHKILVSGATTVSAGLKDGVLRLYMSTKASAIMLDDTVYEFTSNDGCEVRVYPIGGVDNTRHMQDVIQYLEKKKEYHKCLEQLEKMSISPDIAPLMMNDAGCNASKTSKGEKAQRKKRTTKNKRGPKTGQQSDSDEDGQHEFNEMEVEG